MNFPTRSASGLHERTGSIRRAARRILRRDLVFPLLASPLLARALPFGSPPILLLSYPRSRSSWIGEVLAHSPDIAYLREPVTQPYQGLFPKSQPQSTVFDPRAIAANEQNYQRFADAAFAGIPARQLLDETLQASAFAPPGRSRRRLLIKEVNLRAAAWYVQR